MVFQDSVLLDFLGFGSGGFLRLRFVSQDIGVDDVKMVLSAAVIVRIRCYAINVRRLTILGGCLVNGSLVVKDLPLFGYLTAGSAVFSLRRRG